MRFLLSLLSVLILSACSNTFYIVRHAEKAKPTAGASAKEASDPPLSDSGNLRALALKERLRSEGIRHIFSTNYKRTIQTAKPLDEYLPDVQTVYYIPKQDSADAFIQKLKLIRKGNVLVVGHSNTVDDTANKLCGTIQVPGDLKDTEYDNLFIIKRKKDRYLFKREKYGVITN